MKPFELEILDLVSNSGSYVDFKEQIETLLAENCRG